MDRRCLQLHNQEAVKRKRTWTLWQPKKPYDYNGKDQCLDRGAGCQWWQPRLKKQIWPPVRWSVKNEHSARKHPLKQPVLEQCGSPPSWLACEPKKTEDHLVVLLLRTYICIWKQGSQQTWASPVTDHLVCLSKDVTPPELLLQWCNVVVANHVAELKV